MAKYNEQFKINAVGLLRKLKEQGIIVIDSIEIKNVRMLVHELGISSYTIYKWNKELYGEIVEVNDDSDDDSDDDFFDDKESITISTGEKKDIFGIRYYAWFARNLGVKNYSSIVLALLKLAIGNKLIEQSGLIDMKRASGSLKVNGEGL